MRLRCFERYLGRMNTDDCPSPNLVISATRAQVDLILTVLVVLLVGVASFASNGEVRRLPPQNAVRPSLPVETAPSLYEAAKPRVIPKRTEDWLDHWEIGEPSDVVQQRSETP